VSVQRVGYLSDRLIRVTLAGADLESLVVDQPAASVRLLLPSPPTRELVIPSWSGNEFLLPDERRPVIRTFTPRPVAPRMLGLDIVIHDGGLASVWATTATVGDLAAVSGPGRGYSIDPDASDFFLGGDETAIPAIGQLLRALPAQMPVQVHIEVSHPGARIALPDHPLATYEWYDLPPSAAPGDALISAVQGSRFGADARVWVAGEAAAVQRIRRHLFEDRGLSRARVSARGYWKHGRVGNIDDGQK
jgi:NADPH-dependent ferric siderophore reductase